MWSGSQFFPFHRLLFFVRLRGATSASTTAANSKTEHLRQDDRKTHGCVAADLQQNIVKMFEVLKVTSYNSFHSKARSP
jgi:hypothetical protein